MAKALPSFIAPASSGDAEITGAVEHEMKLRCKSGDLALVIQEEDGCEANIGKVVRVTGPIELNSRGQATWLIEPVRQKLWWSVSSEGMVRTRQVTFTCQVEHPDEWLLPINLNLWRLDDAVKEKNPAKSKEFSQEGLRVSNKFTRLKQTALAGQ
jgi:hypothetical protein